MKTKSMLLLTAFCIILLVVGCGSDKSTGPTPLDKDLVDRLLADDGRPIGAAPPADFECIPLQGGAKLLSWSVQPLRGDLNRDEAVSGLDIFLISAKFGLKAGDEGYEANADANADGIIDGQDLYPVALSFGQSREGWQVFKSRASDGADGVKVAEVAFEESMLGEKHQLELSEDQIGPAFYTLRTVGAGEGGLGEPSRVSPAIPYLVSNAKEWKFRIRTVDGSSESTTLRAVYTAPNDNVSFKPEVDFSADASTAVMDLRNGRFTELTRLDRGQYAWSMQTHELDPALNEGYWRTEICGIKGDGSALLIGRWYRLGDENEVEFYEFDLVDNQLRQTASMEVPDLAMSKWWTIRPDAAFTRYVMMHEIGEYDAESTRVRVFDGNFNLEWEVPLPGGFRCEDPVVSGDGSTAFLLLNGMTEAVARGYFVDLDARELVEVFSIDGYKYILPEGGLSWEGERFFSSNRAQVDSEFYYPKQLWISARRDNLQWSMDDMPPDPFSPDLSVDGRFICGMDPGLPRNGLFLIDYDSGTEVFRTLDEDYSTPQF